MSTQTLMLPVVLGLALLALFVPPYVLLLGQLPLTFLPEWELEGVRFDSTDVVLGLVFLSVLSGRKSPTLRGIHRAPYFLSWITIVVLMSVSYLLAETTQRTLTDPFRALYQLYRYCWKELLYFPLGVILLREGRPVRMATWAVLATGFFASASATVQGYRFGEVQGGNGFAAILVVPLALACSGIVAPHSRRHFYVCLGSFLLIIRGILFTGSRGGAASIAATGLFFATFVWRGRFQLRPRLLRLTGLAVLASVVFLASKPDVFERPTVRRALSALEGTQAHTMEWRMQERWPHFWSRAMKRPFLGYATPVDESLGRGGNTPHNGFLALAVAHGFPVAILYLSFGFVTLRNALLIHRRSPEVYVSLLGLVVASSLVGWFVNNTLESTIRMEFVAKLFWLMAAYAAVTAARLRRDQTSRAASPAALASAA